VLQAACFCCCCVAGCWCLAACLLWLLRGALRTSQLEAPEVHAARGGVGAACSSSSSSSSSSTARGTTGRCQPKAHMCWLSCYLDGPMGPGCCQRMSPVCAIWLVSLLCVPHACCLLLASPHNPQGREPLPCCWTGAAAANTAAPRAWLPPWPLLLATAATAATGYLPFLVVWVLLCDSQISAILRPTMKFMQPTSSQPHTMDTGPPYSQR
jgi:hypothetical protein